VTKQGISRETIDTSRALNTIENVVTEKSQSTTCNRETIIRIYARQQRQRDKPNHLRWTDRDNSNGRARTTEATRDEDVITFCSEVHAAHGNADDKSTHLYWTQVQVIT